MKHNGSMTYGDREPLGRGRAMSARVVTCAVVAVAMLLTACATDSEAPPLVQTQAERDLNAGSAALSQPLVSEETAQEGTLLGGLVGGAIAFGIGGRDDNVGIAVPVGMLGGSIAGRYVAAKQAEYSQRVTVIESITRDIQQKNTDTAKTISAMEVVISEHRAELKHLRTAKDKSGKTEARLKQQVARAESDLQTMKHAVAKAEEHLALFGEARGIVISEKAPVTSAEQPAVNSMDSEIDSLRNRIKTMHKLVNDLATVS